MAIKGATIGSYAKNFHDKAWSDAWELIDLQLSPLGRKAIDALNVGEGHTILDIGCGAGQTLCQLAERVGSEGIVIGVDIAPMLLTIAARRSAAFSQVRLIEGDARWLDLPSDSIDAVFSRFGVMGFDDPIGAFANFHRILKPSGLIAFCCWRPLEENELDHFPLRASGIQAPVDATPFSFADPEYLHHVLKSAGFDEIVTRPYDEKVSSGGLDAMTEVLLKVGPLGKLARENLALRTVAEPRLRAALAAQGDVDQIQLMASVWIVTARAPK